MTLYLEVVNGKYAASTLALEAGDICRVGCEKPAEMYLPEAPALAGNHFSLAFDGRRGILIDSGSQIGTCLSGKKIAAQSFDESCGVSAGETEFVVFFEDCFATNYPATPIKRLVQLLKERQRLFCLLDTARDEKILPLLSHSNVRFQSLYQGETQAKLAHVAPYLIEFGDDFGFLEKLLRYGWGKRWLTFFTSGGEFAELRSHFRKYIFVKDEPGNVIYFRFYDPSVLRTFLPACSADELPGFFGIIDSFFYEDELPCKLQTTSIENKRLIRNFTDLSAGG